VAQFAVAALGQDRPGIVSAVTTALAALGCNLEDVTTSVLRGHFSMVLVASGTESADRIRAELAPLERDGILVAVWEVGAAAAPAEATHLLTVYGPDRLGIVSRVASLLAQQGVNITEMSCRLHDAEPPLYVVLMEVQVPEAMAERLGHDLEAALRPLELDHHLSPIERTTL
jgi:glycine cleavage system transcriptional repressor